MTNKTTPQIVAGIIAEQLGVDADAVKPEANLVTDFAADSLDLVEVAMAIEDELGIELADEDCEKCATVADWAALAERSLSK